MRKRNTLWRESVAPQLEPTAPAVAGDVVGIDCDGVLASDRLLWQVLHKRYPLVIPASYEQLATYEWPRVSTETTNLCVRLSADPAFAGRLAPIPHMAEALRHLWEAGYHLHIVTARPPAVRHATWRWLVRHGVAPYVDEIHCVALPPDKVALAQRLGCIAFVEDNYTTAEAVGAVGIRSYLLDAPYNRAPAAHAVRVRDWQALLADVLRHEPVAARSKAGAAVCASATQPGKLVS